MDYKFELSCPDYSDFRCELAISGDQTFQQLHDKIVEIMGYDTSQLASFFTIDRMGDRGKEIALMDMASDEEEGGTLIMELTKISDVIKPGCLELEYVFDFFGDRFFRVEFAGEYIGDSSDILPHCILLQGKVPNQFSYSDDKEDWEFDKDDDEYDESFMDEFDNGGYDDDRDDDDYDRENEDYDDNGREFESLDDYIDRL